MNDGRSSSSDDEEEKGASIRDASTAYEKQFVAHGDALRRYSTRFIGSPEAAEDVVQEAFWRLWRVWPRLTPDTNVRAYLYTAVRHHALNYLRRRRVEERNRVYVTPPPVSEGPILPSDGEAQIASDEIAAAVERIIGSMPRRQRQVAVLRLRDQLSSADIARMLGISTRTVEGHIAQITRTLREQLPLLLG